MYTVKTRIESSHPLATFTTVYCVEKQDGTRVGKHYDLESAQNHCDKLNSQTKEN